MGAAFLCAIAEIANEHTDRDTTAYIQSWISKLEEDNRLIVHAAANAQRAVDLILGSRIEEENETTENAGDAAGSGIPVAAYLELNYIRCAYGKQSVLLPSPATVTSARMPQSFFLVVTKKREITDDFV